ncbi:GIY-YIG nuclease family protein [Pseudomonas putida]|uniref:GIY-YIG nuclease family protein n=1 Tax=Pseudomonas putida TaxID=303 RepID=UPI00227130AB|nr:GIY-YIG nuclease family protein [Pseudomonas putida]WAC00088.1 GIY-YIG nuclease family protein [Pseudomonas putida]
MGGYACLALKCIYANLAFALQPDSIHNAASLFMDKPMLGKHFLYILVRTNGISYKMGISSDFKRRVNDLNRECGPFCLKRSFTLRTDNRKDATDLETMLKTLYADYNTPLPEKKFAKGETEWFAEECYDGMVESLKTLACVKMGDGYSLQAIDHKLIKPITENGVIRQQAFQSFLEGLSNQIRALCSNTHNARSFRAIIKEMTRHLIGVVRLQTSDHSNHYEIFFSPDTPASFIDSILQISRLTADNRKIWAGANLCTSTQSCSLFKKACFSIRKDMEGLEQSWESKGKSAIYRAMLDEHAERYPLPPAYQSHVGRSFIDDLTEEETAELGRALWSGLFNRSHINNSKRKDKKAFTKKHTELKTIPLPKSVTPNTLTAQQLKLEFD